HRIAERRRFDGDFVITGFQQRRLKCPIVASFYLALGIRSDIRNRDGGFLNHSSILIPNGSFDCSFIGLSQGRNGDEREQKQQGAIAHHKANDILCRSHDETSHGKRSKRTLSLSVKSNTSRLYYKCMGQCAIHALTRFETTYD